MVKKLNLLQTLLLTILMSFILGDKCNAQSLHRVTTTENGPLHTNRLTVQSLSVDSIIVEHQKVTIKFYDDKNEVIIRDKEHQPNHHMLDEDHNLLLLRIDSIYVSKSVKPFINRTSSNILDWIGPHRVFPSLSVKVYANGEMHIYI